MSKVLTCKCKWCRAQMHTRDGSSTMRHAGRKIRRMANADVKRMVRTGDFEATIRDRISVPPIA
jgi:hypothetical protein